MRTMLGLGLVCLLAACQPSDGDSATEAGADATEAPATPTNETPPAEPPPAYIGAWVADLAWCGNTTGPERPIQVTATEFQGYENTCQITELQPADAGWTAIFICAAEGSTTSSPVRIEADDDSLKITWIDEGYDVEWRRCRA